MHSHRRTLRGIAALLLCLSSITAAAQEETASSTLLLREFMGECPAMVEDILSDPEFGTLVKDRPHLVDDICLCASVSIGKDERLRDRLDRISVDSNPDEVFEGIKSYLYLRLMSALFVCMGTEFDAMLATAPLDGTAAPGTGSAPPTPAKP